MAKNQKGGARTAIIILAITIEIATHGYCNEMAAYLDTELDAMVS
ncbi:MAG: hypothetical protein WBE22_00965 [Halobacteriota archaeon]